MDLPSDGAGARPVHHAGHGPGGGLGGGDDAGINAGSARAGATTSVVTSQPTWQMNAVTARPATWSPQGWPRATATSPASAPASGHAEARTAQIVDPAAAGRQPGPAEQAGWLRRHAGGSGNQRSASNSGGSPVGPSLRRAGRAARMARACCR